MKVIDEVKLKIIEKYVDKIERESYLANNILAKVRTEVVKEYRKTTENYKSSSIGDFEKFAKKEYYRVIEEDESESEVEISKKDFKQEHVKLVKILETGTDKQQKKEGEEQKKEMNAILKFKIERYEFPYKRTLERIVYYEKPENWNFLLSKEKNSFYSDINRLDYFESQDAILFPNKYKDFKTLPATFRSGFIKWKTGLTEKQYDDLILLKSQYAKLRKPMTGSSAKYYKDEMRLREKIKELESKQK